MAMQVFPSFSSNVQTKLANRVARFCGAMIACTLFAVDTSHAEYFSDYEQEKPTPPPSLEWGADYLGRWSAGGYDHWLDANISFRLNRHWDLPISIETPLGSLGISGLVAGRWFPTGRLQKDGYEDWLQLGVGAITTKSPWDPSCESCTEWRVGPQVDFAYGRDILPWEKSPLGFRLGVDAAWVFGNVLTRSTTGIFGLPQTKLGNLILSLRIGCFWIN